MIFVFTGVGTRVYHSQKRLRTYRSRKNVVPTVSTSAWTRLYHSQKQQSVYRLRKCGFRRFRGYKNAHLPFVK